jgi:hypothetical protein
MDILLALSSVFSRRLARFAMAERDSGPMRPPAKLDPYGQA